MALETRRISCCFDERSSAMLEDYRRHGLSDTSAVILDYLAGTGLCGTTVLELGCGVGALADELVRAGAASARGLDLSSQMVANARSLASALGTSGSATFEVGDAATAPLPSSDNVVLDAVLCCYPDAGALLRNSSSAALKKFVLSIPDDRRPVIKVLKRFLPIQSLVSRGSFRFYVHPVGSLVDQMLERGFRLVFQTRVGWFWSVLSFERA